MTHLSVDSIADVGGFTGGVVKREVIWKEHGKNHKADVHIRPMSYHTAVNDIMAKDESRPMVVARRLAACLCDADGVPLFRVSDITGLDDEGKPILIKDKASGEMVERGPFSPNLTTALLILVGEVSGVGKQTNPSAPQK